jgi:AraC-like DNA-binding protein
VKEPRSRRLQAKDRSDPAFHSNRSLIPDETAISSLLDHMHVTGTSYASLQGEDLPRKFQTREDEFVGLFVARGAIELRTSGGLWLKGNKASYFLISRRTEFQIRKARSTDCVLGWLSFQIDGLQARMLLRTLPEVIVLRDLGKDEFDWQIMLETLISNLPNALSPAASAINRRLIEVALISLIQTAISRDRSLGSQRLQALSSQMAPAFRHIHSTPETGWTTASLAETVRMSRSLFCKSFLDAIGTTPIKYLKIVRLELAANLLRQTDLALSEVAHRVGYQSDEAFLRAFKTMYATTPGKFRNQKGLT